MDTSRADGAWIPAWLGITLYPAVSNYLLEKNQSTAMQGYIEEQGKVPDEVSEHLKQEAREYKKN